MPTDMNEVAPGTELPDLEAGVRLEVSPEGLAVATLAKPEKHNCFDELTIDRLSTIFDDLGRQDGIRALIIRAEGASFSAGGDLNWMRRQATQVYDENLTDARGLATMFARLDRLPMPTIAMVDGPAYGGGVGLVACCDIALGTPKAAFALSEVKIGLMPATIAPYVQRAIGARNCRRYFQTGERFGAEDALRMGLLSEVLPDAVALEERMSKLVDAIFLNAPGAVARAKSLVAEIEDMPIDDRLGELTAVAIAKRRATEEAKEGLSAFLEKRRPDWQS
ncbi:enoyl-CoA hydratase-related protein [Zavarzinia sp.]|uniref:enoyl-CoA hydratase-related protein n=1 Tax=Zavarzinia sp. TaxID=2027920 RepID=UPI003563DDB2